MRQGCSTERYIDIRAQSMSKSGSTVSEPTTDEKREYESDMDALHVLPLSIIPFDVLGLKRAKLIKNVRLETVIEIFRDASAGSGQIRVEEAAKILGITEEEPHPDLTKLKSLANLNSFDVFSLRIELRNVGVTLEEHAELKLSKSKNEELTEYMREFTRPIISQVYAGSSTSITDVNNFKACLTSVVTVVLKDEQVITQQKLTSNFYSTCTFGGDDDI